MMHKGSADAQRSILNSRVSSENDEYCRLTAKSHLYEKQILLNTLF